MWDLVFNTEDIGTAWNKEGPLCTAPELRANSSTWTVSSESERLVQFSSFRCMDPGKQLSTAAKAWNRADPHEQALDLENISKQSSTGSKFNIGNENKTEASLPGSAELEISMATGVLPETEWELGIQCWGILEASFSSRTGVIWN